MSCDVSVIGEIYLDHVFSGFTNWPQPGEEIFTDEYVAELGGGAVTTACALARLGRTVQLIGVVGRREFTGIAERLGDFGVSADGLVRSEGRTGVTVSVSTQHDRTFFTFTGANRELPEVLANDQLLLGRAAAARHVHLAFPLPTAGAANTLSLLRQRGATISLDVGHQVEWLTYPANHIAVREVDYFLPNQKEAALLAGSAAQYLAFCRSQGIRSAVLKLGADGAVMLADAIEYRVPAFPGPVVDTTGAGDVFNAGFIDALLDGAPPEASLQRACACGTISVGAAGALGALPDRAELERFLASTSAPPEGKTHVT